MRETFAQGGDVNNEGLPLKTWYKADYELGAEPSDVIRWRPSIHMPRKLARIFLEITDVRVERVRDIPKTAFRRVWQKTYGDDGWDKNPWVWVIEFKGD